MEPTIGELWLLEYELLSLVRRLAAEARTPLYDRAPNDPYPARSRRIARALTQARDELRALEERG